MEPTDIWVFLKTRRVLIGQVLAGILLFALGWQVGRISSPYYAAHPIVFSDCAASSGVAAVSSPEELAVLAAPSPSAPAVTMTPAASVAAARESDFGVADKLFVGSIRSDKYHHRDCPTWQRIKEENRIWFSSVEEAEAQGYVPTKCTQEKLRERTAP